MVKLQEMVIIIIFSFIMKVVETYLETCQNSIVMNFAKRVNGFWPMKAKNQLEIHHANLKNII